MELLSEGNEAKRGDEKSQPLNSTDEAGELTPGDPAEGRRRSVYGTSGGKDDVDIEPRGHLNETKEDSETGEERSEAGYGIGAFWISGCPTALLSSEAVD